MPITSLISIDYGAVILYDYSWRVLFDLITRGECVSWCSHRGLNVVVGNLHVEVMLWSFADQPQSIGRWSENITISFATLLRLNESYNLKHKARVASGPDLYPERYRFSSHFGYRKLWLRFLWSPLIFPDKCPSHTFSYPSTIFLYIIFSSSSILNLIFDPINLCSWYSVRK
jgi:hypothetical protein